MLGDLPRFDSAPGPTVWGPLGHLTDFHRDPLGATLRGFAEYGDVCRFRLGPTNAFLLARPEHIQHVLVDQPSNYDKKIRSYQLVGGLVGNGLLTSGGSLWQWQRKTARPAFQHGRVVAMAPAMARIAEDIADSWAATALRGRPVSLHRDMMRYTLMVAGQCLMGSDVRAASPYVAHALEVYLDDYHQRLYNPFALPEWIPTQHNLSLRAERWVLARLVRKILEKRSRAPGAHDDLLAMVLAAHREEGGRLGAEQLHGEVLMLLVASHETTANALTFTLYLLARYPDVARRLRAELADVLGGRTPGYEDLARLPFTKRVLEESMRLYPPSWMINRRAKADDRIGGYPIPQDSIILLSPFVTHRHPELWENPRRFDPDRFDPEKIHGRHRFAFFPFGGGHRVCIGGEFGMLEMRLLIAVLAQRFELILEDEAPLELDARSTLRPRRELRLRLREISPAAVG